MEGLTRLVSESLVRHGLDRPVDYRRLRWSRWFRCESHHSLLLVPSKAGVFALAEEIVDFDNNKPGLDRVSGPVMVSEAPGPALASDEESNKPVEERGFSSALSASGAYQGMASSMSKPTTPGEVASAADGPHTRRMLAVTHFFQDDDMAFVLDRMLTKENPLRAYLNCGRCFIRFVIIEDPFHRRQIHNSLAQWLSDSAQKASGIGSHFATSLELTPATEYIPPATAVPGSPRDRQIGKAAASAAP